MSGHNRCTMAPERKPVVFCVTMYDAEFNSAQVKWIKGSEEGVSELNRNVHSTRGNGFHMEWTSAKEWEVFEKLWKEKPCMHGLLHEMNRCVQGSPYTHNAEETKQQDAVGALVVPIFFKY